nr:uncharacterized protein LOC111425998 isoform X1 [Onthophagus taurus]
MTKKFKFRLCVLVWATLSFAQAGPVDRYLRIIREVYPEIEPEKADGSQKQVCVVGDVVYTAEESVPSEQPCLKCKCQPPGVHCETTRCQKKPGCRAIHKPNECCPEYQCASVVECEFEGKVYGNGERLETKPGGECKVCYCRGGEVQCTEVSCYIRTDCEGRRVPGQCCQKYEHCPPIEPIQEKVKSESFFSSTQISSEFTGNISSENEISDTTDIQQKLKSTSLINEITPPPDMIEETDHKEEPRITIHEIIPGLIEIPITETTKLESTTKIQGQLLVEEKVTNNDNLVDHTSHDSKTEETNLSQIFEKHPPSVITVGNETFYLKKDVFDDITIAPSTNNNPEVFIEDTKPETHVIKKEIKESEENAAIIIQELPKIITSTTEVNVGNSTIDVAVELPAAEPIDIEAEGSESEPVRVDSALVTIKIEEVTVKIDKPKIDDVLENPAYPPIPDIMVPQDAEYNPEIVEIHEEFYHSSTESPKIIPEILEITNNHTFSENTTNLSWLKSQSLINEKAILPDTILKQVAISDIDQTTNTNLLTTLNKIDGLTEELKETTSPSSLVKFHTDDLIKHAIIESESVIENHVKKIVDDHDITGSLHDTIKEDLKESINQKAISTESIEQPSESGENTTPKGIQTVSAMLNENASVETAPDSKEDQKLIKTTKNPDVEVINSELLSTNTDLNTNLTHEEIKPKKRDQTLPTTTIKPLSESDKIFEELGTELKVLADDYVSPDQSDKSKDDVVFKELLDELNTKKKPSKESKDPIQRATDKLANLKLRDARQSLDVGVIGAVRDLFTAQYRSYAKK